MLVVWSYGNLDVFGSPPALKGYKNVTLIPTSDQSNTASTTTPAPKAVAVVCQVSWVLLLSASCAVVHMVSGIIP
jgi:hypothetical protein